MSLLSRLFGRQRDEGLQSLTPEEYFAGDEAWTVVSSSHVHSAAYYGQGRSGELRLRFKDRSGRVTAEYYYRGVSPETYQRLLAADSKGTYAHRNIYGRYEEGPVWRTK